MWLQISLGFGFWVRQKVRLRGIDAAELDTAAGRKAKRLIEAECAKVSEIIVTTTKPDKYDRYLSDLWIGETNLNKLLLSKGLARLKTEISEPDWDDSNQGRF